MKELVDAIQANDAETVAVAMAKVLTIVRGNLVDLRNACAMGMEGARELRDGWTNLQERLGSLKQSLTNPDSTTAELSLLKKEWSALAAKAAQLKGMHDVPTGVVAGVPREEQQVA